MMFRPWAGRWVSDWPTRVVAWIAIVVCSLNSPCCQLKLRKTMTQTQCCCWSNPCRSKVWTSFFQCSLLRFVSFFFLFSDPVAQKQTSSHGSRGWFWQSFGHGSHHQKSSTDVAKMSVETIWAVFRMFILPNLLGNLRTHSSNPPSNAKFEWTTFDSFITPRQKVEIHEKVFTPKELIGCKTRNRPYLI